MTTLAADELRSFEANIDPLFNDLKMIASDIIFEGAAVGDNASGFARPLVAADPFMGFATKKADNASGNDGDVRVHVRSRGVAELVVASASSVADIGESVYAFDDNYFTLSASGNSAIGKVHRHVSGTTCMVGFEAVSVRSI